ncbi:hypothetical protein WOLCODRAFT_73912 [Wolfiporia cocos MD-104 SS10]|uniref:G protein-coupled receptor 89 n=1 Tax=Wolfiporia cocos (strain MD-104) TaxID=742152 RepID=A0A2H3JM05_WOLCO|nr:hypothetical protein WOLCODRAFT_73912 [Wolfiporia cocos MD-104 SS10]
MDVRSLIPELFARLVLFFACRKYLLRHLYHDLQDLSVQRTAEPGTPPVSEDPAVELETLPTPSTSASSSTPVVSAKRPFHSVLSRTLFSLCFSESCMLFLLLMSQTLDALHSRTRLINWNISLSLLLTVVIVLIPLSYSLVLSDRSPSASGVRQRPSALRILLNFVPVGIFLFLLSYIPLPSAVPSSNMITTILSRLIVVGTITLGALSGFGAINTAWTFFPVLRSKARNNPSAEDVRMAEQGLQRVQEDLAQRRMEVQKMQTAQVQSNWFARVVPSFRGDTPMQELAGLETLEYEMSRNLDALRQRHADAQFGRTLFGRLVNWGGRLFAIYCIYRILNSAANLVIPARRAANTQESATTGADMISMALAYVFALIPSVDVSVDQVAVVSRQISLVLVGIIILSSLRLVLRGVARALRVTSRNLGASLMLLILAQLMGIYLLSTLIQLRTTFPPPPVRPDGGADDRTVNLFSTLPKYQLFGALFDGSFLVAAGGSAVVRWFGDRINSVGETD